MIQHTSSKRRRAGIRRNQARLRLIVFSAAALAVLWAVLAIAFHFKAKADMQLLTEVTIQDICTQGTCNAVTARIGKISGRPPEEYPVLIYRLEALSADRAGKITSFEITLARQNNKNAYDLYTMDYSAEDALLNLRRTDKNLNLKKTGADLSKLPSLNLIKTLETFPFSYFVNIRPITEGSSYEFKQYTDTAQINVPFSDHISGGLTGIWISKDGGCSQIRPDFVPNGNYILMECTPMDFIPEGERTDKKIAKEGVREFLIMMELPASLSIGK